MPIHSPRVVAPKLPSGLRAAASMTRFSKQTQKNFWIQPTLRLSPLKLFCTFARDFISQTHSHCVTYGRTVTDGVRARILKLNGRLMPVGIKEPIRKNQSSVGNTHYVIHTLASRCAVGSITSYHTLTRLYIAQDPFLTLLSPQHLAGSPFHFNSNSQSGFVSA